MSDALLTEALSTSSVHQLRRWVQENHAATKGATLKVYVLRNHMVDGLADFLKAWGYKAGFNVVCQMGDYNQLEQEVIGSNSGLSQFHPDVIILSFVYDPALSLDRVRQLLKHLESQQQALIIGNTFFQPVYRASDNAVTAFNEAYVALTHIYKILRVIDWNRLEQQLGVEKSRDHRFWYTAKILLTPAFLNLYAADIIQQIGHVKGKIKKVLVLDADGTLWGGIIGEDGLDGIALNPHDYPGNVYYDFQQEVLRLHDQGIMIALCSKNNEADVWEVLDKHPHCLIKREHLSAWQINWDDKVANMKALAKTLNVGMDSFVFVDDNPTECAWVKGNIEGIDILSVPTNLFSYPALLSKSGLFTERTLTAEDKERTRMMQQEQVRQSQTKDFQDPESFLKSLDLVANVWTATDKDNDRATQLTQKTNQFNLTTRRYSASQMQAFMQGNSEVLVLSLKDRFGDYGVVGLAILKYAGDDATIDTFLMSCRVLGKRVEEVLLKSCMQKAKARGMKRMVGEYIPTPKNQQTKDFYAKQKFDIVKQNGEGATFGASLEHFQLNWPPSYHDIILN